MNSNVGRPIYQVRGNAIKYGTVLEEQIDDRGWMHYRIDWLTFKDESFHRRDHVNFFNPLREIEHLSMLIRKGDDNEKVW